MSRPSVFSRALIGFWGAGAFALQIFAASSPEAAAPLPTPASTAVDALQEEVQRVFERTRGAVVRIVGIDSHGPLSGTGFFVDPAGTLLTAYTIGGEAEGLTVEFGNRKYPARRVAADARSGIALLKVEAETPFLTPVSGSGLPEVASAVVAIGYPVDLDATPSFGIIAGHDRKYLGRFFSTTHIRANVPVQRGQGGAPLLNLKGEVVGVLLSTVDNGTACFALPIQAAEKVRANSVRFGDARHGWLGVTVEPVDGSVRVAQVIPKSPAEGSGVRPGDLLQAVGSREIRVPEDTLDASFFLTAGEPIEIHIIRDGARQSLTLVPSDPPGKPALHAGEPTLFRGGPLLIQGE
jgi:serine protease Do